ncbi:M28 family peptidase [Pontibacter silvestris]|uniref:M28 family peptidase n=1 Tax=Pontibacter silvestris TaxID=2305183 RepID=A0ABW4WZ99_9BACT
MKKVKPKDIKGHIEYLADDRLLGRMPGTEGYKMAADYVIDKFKSMGIEPAGENGSYLQDVTIRKAVTGNDATFISRDSLGNKSELIHGKDFVIFPNAVEKQTTLEAPLVFAGFGISAPEIGYDDYAGIDATGKVVVVMRGAPDSFTSTVAASSMDIGNILQTAANHGAVGVVMAFTNPTAGVPNISRGVNSVLGPDGGIAVSRYYVSDDVKLFSFISGETLTNFLAKAGLDFNTSLTSLKNATPVSAPLNTTIRASYSSSHEDINSYNVIGKITGSDPLLKNEFVIHSAHLDHVGIGAPVNGDSIYNGAHDNASGVASLLEIARIYSRIDAKPKRTVLIAMVTGEEMGLLGSSYFAKYPTVPKQNIVANINTDMPTIIAPLLSVVALGAEHSTLDKPVANAASYLGLDVEEDPEPEQNRFVRSDQYSFVSQGIPALHIKYGNKTPDGKNNLNEQVQVWREKYYHKPQDSIDGTFDFDAGKTYVQLNFLIGYQVAQNPERPSWNPGDFFETAR